MADNEQNVVDNLIPEQAVKAATTKEKEKDLSPEEQLELIMNNDSESNKHRARFIGYPWYKQCNPENTAIVGGLGTLGSYLSFALTRMNLPIIGFDHGVIKKQNIGGQLYSIRENGMSKNRALKSFIDNYCGSDLMSTEGKFEKDSYMSDLAFACFDSIPARKLMYEEWRKYIKEAEKMEKGYSKNCWFFDLRMRGLDWSIRIVRGSDSAKQFKAYEKSFKGFTKKDQERDGIALEQCSLRSTSHVGMESAARVTSYLTNVFANRELGVDALPVPRYTFRSQSSGLELTYNDRYE